MTDNLVTFNIPIEHIHPHPDNPRKDLGDITELTESIRKNGIMQNLSVIPMEGKEDEYMLVIGHRRCAAAKAAGLKEVPCRIINDLEYKEQLAVMLEENMQRNDLTIIEQADCFQMMLDLGEDIETLEKKTGFSKQTIKHRVEIAKLDKKILREKAENESFQLSIKDLQMLEKIDDIDARNEVLKSADNSGQLAWKTGNMLQKIENDRNKENIIKMLEEKGVKPAPEKYMNERYTNKWNMVKEYTFKEPPKIIKLPKSEEPYYYYVTYYSSIEIIQKNKVTKTELTEGEKKKKARDAAKKELEAIEKKLDADIREFVIGIKDGKYTIPKSYERQLIKEVWDIITQLDFCDTTISSMMVYISGKYLYDMTQEEKVQYREEIEKLTMLQQMIICMARNIKSNCSIVSYDCTCKENESKRYQEAVNILEGLGFSIEDTERQFIDGTHELWGKGGTE